MILVDTSVWIDHLHQTERDLVDLLEDSRVLCHPLVVTEVALGSMARREEVLSLLDALPAARAAHDAEVRALISAHRLWGRGLSAVDAHLLAATLITPGTLLWTRDRRLLETAGDLSVAHGPP